MTRHGAHLPDELVKDILTPLLTVPDHLFSNTSSVSPFATPSVSSSSVLVVCKQWMRVATPLLYNVVVLRSKAQAQALERTLKTNSDVRRYVKKLRLEGGFGPSMRKIIPELGYVTHLCLSMEIWSSDNVSGLAKSLHLLTPEHIILREGVENKYHRTLDNACTRVLLKKLCECVRYWDKLKTFDFPYAMRGINEPFGMDLALALAQSPSVETVFIHTRFRVDLLRVIATNTTKLRRIHVKPLSTGRWEFDLYNVPNVAQRARVDADPRLRSLVYYEDEPLCGSAPSQELALAVSPDPFYLPMSAASNDIKEEIWSKIIYFVAQPDEIRQTLPKPTTRKPYRIIIGDKTDRSTPLSTKHTLAIASVSKQFRRLAEPHLYRDVRLMRLQSVVAFCDLLKRKPHLSLHIRTLSFCRLVNPRPADDFMGLERYSDDIDQDTAMKLDMLDGALEYVVSVATKVTDVTQVDAYREKEDWLPWDVLGSFPGPETTNIQRILSLHILPPSSNAAFSVLNKFSRLVHLKIEVDVEQEEFAAPALDSQLVTDILSPDSLPLLERLDYTETCFPSYEPTELSFLSVLAELELPSLHTLYLGYTNRRGALRTFLQAHGSKILESNILYDESKRRLLHYCGNMRTLTFSKKVPDVCCFNRSTPHTSLEKILIDDIGTWNYDDAYWDPLFNDIDLSLYPSLKEFSVNEFLWPKNEKEVLKGKNRWIGRSDRLLKEFNVKLTDFNGKHWIPRLTSADVRR